MGLLNFEYLNSKILNSRIVKKITIRKISNLQLILSLKVINNVGNIKIGQRNYFWTILDKFYGLIGFLKVWCSAIQLGSERKGLSRYLCTLVVTGGSVVINFEPFLEF